jgi:hypothetical protein
MMLLAGAPLDVIKTIAAVLMLGDHINSALVDPPSSWSDGSAVLPFRSSALFSLVTSSAVWTHARTLHGF